MFEFIERYFGKDEEDNVEHFSQWRLKRKKSKSSGWGIVIVLLFIIAVVLLIYVSRKVEGPQGTASQAPAPMQRPTGSAFAAAAAPVRGGWRGKKFGKAW